MGVAAKIGKVAKERGISIKELSRQADIPYTTLYHAVKRDSKMDPETIQKIAGALGCYASDLDESFATAMEEAKKITKVIYGTTDKNEAYKVVFSRWYQKLDAGEKRSVFDVVKYLQKLNGDGKQVAAERIEELTQIPKYQRQPAPQDSPAGPDDKEPTKK